MTGIMQIILLMIDGKLHDMMMLGVVIIIRQTMTIRSDDVARQVQTAAPCPQDLEHTLIDYLLEDIPLHHHLVVQTTMTGIIDPAPLSNSIATTVHHLIITTSHIRTQDIMILCPVLLPPKFTADLQVHLTPYHPPYQSSQSAFSRLQMTPSDLAFRLRRVILASHRTTRFNSPCTHAPRFPLLLQKSLLL